MEIRVFRKLKRPPQKPPVALTQADTMTSAPQHWWALLALQLALAPTDSSTQTDAPELKLWRFRSSM